MDAATFKLISDVGIPLAVAVAIGYVAWRVLQLYLKSLEQRIEDLKEIHAKQLEGFGRQMAFLEAQLDEADKERETLQTSLNTETRELLNRVMEQERRNASAVFDWLKELRDWRIDIGHQFKALHEMIKNIFPDAIEKLVQGEIRRIVEERYAPKEREK